MDPEQIFISAETTYVPKQSNPLNKQFVFFYTITIHNASSCACQLLSRHWVIQDANRKTEEVYGEGVVGEQPIIEPGASYTYSSGAVLETEMGTMEGRYFMVWKVPHHKELVEFEALIPKFTLSVPRTLH